MPRKPELSATQLAASGLATVTATFGASYLGVAGTIWGAAFMSVASTAGIAVYKHYLDEGRRKVWERSQTPEEVERAAGEATSADPTRTVVWPAGTIPGDPAETVVDGALPPADVTRVDLPPVHAPVAAPGRAESTLEWMKRRWFVLAASSVTVFAVVMGGITLVEALADKPVSTIVGATDDKGTSFGNVGGSGDTTRKQKPTQKPTERQPSKEPGKRQPPPSTGRPTVPSKPSPAPTRKPTPKPTPTGPVTPNPDKQQPTAPREGAATPA